MLASSLSPLPLPGAMLRAMDMAEGAAAMAQDQLHLRISLLRAADLLRQAGQDRRPDLLNAGFIGDQRSAKFEEYDCVHIMSNTISPACSASPLHALRPKSK